MKRVMIVLPACDFDPSEVAVSWKVLTDAGCDVRFATPSGFAASADDIMVTGAGLDPWSRMPALTRFRVLGLMLRANGDARRAYTSLLLAPAFVAPLRYAQLNVDDFDALVLPGGHRARGMRAYLEDPVLQAFVGGFFDTGKPVGAICHGVVLAARSRSPVTQRSSLYGRKTTALTWKLERSAWNITRFFGRTWDGGYYRTYEELPGEAPGAKSVEAEVTAALAGSADFIHVPANDPAHFRKTSGLFRDSPTSERVAHIVVDGNYVSARWPGDVHTFARRLATLIADRDITATHEALP